MIYVDVPTPECFEDDDLNCDAAWKNIQNFKTVAEAVMFLRFHLGDAQVTDDGYVRLITGMDDEPVCEACGGMGFLPNCERCDACEFFESDDAAREHIYGMAMRHHVVPTKVAVEVHGGCVTCISTNDKSVEAIVFDHDNIEAGDEPPAFRDGRDQDSCEHAVW